MAIKSRKKYTSAGIHSSVNHGITQAVKADRTHLDKLSFITDAWKAFKNPWITIENPDKAATNKRHIRVRTNDLWGNPKFFNMKEPKSNEN
jgi:hypothetical protein